MAENPPDVSTPKGRSFSAASDKVDDGEQTTKPQELVKRLAKRMNMQYRYLQKNSEIRDKWMNDQLKR